jgi:hypothetical protein
MFSMLFDAVTVSIHYRRFRGDEAKRETNASPSQEKGAFQISNPLSIFESVLSTFTAVFLLMSLMFFLFFVHVNHIDDFLYYLCCSGSGPPRRQTSIVIDFSAVCNSIKRVSVSASWRRSYP